MNWSLPETIKFESFVKESCILTKVNFIQMYENNSADYRLYCTTCPLLTLNQTKSCTEASAWTQRWRSSDCIQLQCVIRYYWVLVITETHNLWVSQKREYYRRRAYCSLSKLNWLLLFWCTLFCSNSFSETCLKDIYPFVGLFYLKKWKVSTMLSVQRHIFKSQRTSNL